MNFLLFGIGFTLALSLVYWRAWSKGYVDGIGIGMHIFKAKLPADTYLQICQSRVVELHALKVGKR